jgi:hypothetical protein
MTNHFRTKGNAWALFRFSFYFHFLGAGIWLKDFYAFLPPAVLLGIIAAFII